MKNMIKRAGALCCALALFTLLCLPTSVLAKADARNPLPSGIEYPMRRAIDEGRDAMDNVMPIEDGTVNDITQGASDGVLDSQGSMTDGASASDQMGTTDKTEGEERGMSTVAIVIACIAAVAIIVLVFIAIPKSKSKPGGTGDRH